MTRVYLRMRLWWMEGIKEEQGEGKLQRRVGSEGDDSVVSEGE